MRKIFQKIAKIETGQALPIALVLLLLGSFLAVPSLSFMTTSLNYNRTIEDYDARLYAADAGIQYALWTMQDDPSILPAEGMTIQLDFPEADRHINGVASVEISIINMGDRIYRIVSTATGSSTGTGSSPPSTRLQSDVYFFNLSNLARGAITSNCDVNINNSTIDGDIYYCDECGDAKINKSTYDNLYAKCQTNWPTADELKSFYGDRVDKNDPFPYKTIYASDYPQGIGPIYRNGDLTIDNRKDNVILPLNGTIYITGNLTSSQTGNKNYTLNLNGQTIFVEGSINFAGGVTLMGSGCIIAIGDINFQPNIGSSQNDFILVMSVQGTVNFQPNGSFYGALVGKSEVEMKNGTLIWTDPKDKALNFPGLGGGNGNGSSSGKPDILTYLITKNSNPRIVEGQSLLTSSTNIESKILNKWNRTVN